MMIANKSRPNFVVTFHQCSTTESYPVHHPVLWWGEENGVPMFALSELEFALAGKPDTIRVHGETYRLREDMGDYLCKRRVYVLWWRVTAA